MRRQWLRRRASDRRPRDREDGTAKPEREGLRPHRRRQDGAREALPGHRVLLRHRDPRHQRRGPFGRWECIHGARRTEGQTAIQGRRREPAGAGEHGRAGYRFLRQPRARPDGHGPAARRAHGGRHALQRHQELPPLQLWRQGRRHRPEPRPVLRVRVQDLRVPQQAVVGWQRRVPGRPAERPQGGQHLLQDAAETPRRALRRPEPLRPWRLHQVDGRHARQHRQLQLALPQGARQAQRGQRPNRHAGRGSQGLQQVQLNRLLFNDSRQFVQSMITFRVNFWVWPFLSPYMFGSFDLDSVQHSLL